MAVRKLTTRRGILKKVAGPDIALRPGRTLRRDPAKEEFMGDDQAFAMIIRAMRSPWHL